MYKRQLEGLSKVIRSRFKLFRRVKAITAEAKWSGMFLSAFPIGALVMINVVQPTYYDAVKDAPEFIPAALVVAVFLIAVSYAHRGRSPLGGADRGPPGCRHSPQTGD